MSHLQAQIQQQSRDHGRNEFRANEVFEEILVEQKRKLESVEDQA